MGSASGFGAVAAGDINPRRFVKQGSGSGKVVQADANAVIYGISQSGTRRFDSAIAASAGEGLRVYFPGEICELETGAAVSQNDRLKADSVGRGVVVSAADGQQYGAIALEAAGAAGVFIKVRVEIGVHSVAGTA